MKQTKPDLVKCTFKSYTIKKISLVTPKFDPDNRILKSHQHHLIWAWLIFPNSNRDCYWTGLLNTRVMDPGRSLVTLATLYLLDPLYHCEKELENERIRGQAHPLTGRWGRQVCRLSLCIPVNVEWNSTFWMKHMYKG